MIKEPKYLKKNSILLAAFLLLSPFALLFSQEGNLVINPSFEEKIDFESQAARHNWTKCLKNDTPDYISFTERGEPDFYYREYIGGLLPYDGDAYVGVFCYRIHPLNGIDEVREFIQTPLSHKLIKDTLYTISIQVALDPESNTAINNFNVYFTEEPIFKKREKEMFDLQPRIKFKRIYYESTLWMKLETQYKARGNEAQIVFGNFLSDKSTGKKKGSFESEMLAKWDVHELERVAYYYVDMVSVMKTSETIPITESKEILLETKREPAGIPDSSNLEIARVQHDSSIVLNHIFFALRNSFLIQHFYDFSNWNRFARQC